MAEYKLSYTASEIEQKLGQVDVNEKNIVDLSDTINDYQSHKANTAIHVTAEEKQAWNNKATEKYVDDEIADLKAQGVNVTASNIKSALGYTPANQSDIPTKTSQLTNDSGFLTQHQDLSGYAKTENHYTKSESDNKYQPKGNYLTQHQDLSDYAKKATTLAGYGITDGATKQELANLSGTINDQQAELDEYQSLTLCVHTDGLIYLFKGGVPKGTGLEIKAEEVAGDVVGTIDEDNNILLSGDIADGTYTLKYKDAEGNYKDGGTLTVSNIVYYTITQNLTNVTTDNSVASVQKGQSFTANLTASDGYNLSSVVVTMGGTDISSTAVSGSTISIASVTGNIVITAVATETAVTPSYTNLLPLAVNADGSDYVGTNGEDGYKSGYKMSTSGGGESATSGAYCSGFMPISSINDVIRVKNITLSGSANVNNFVFYDSSKTKITPTSTCNGTANAFHSSVDVEGNGVYACSPYKFMTATQGSDIAFFRFSCGGITDDTIVTVNEEIV